MSTAIPLLPAPFPYFGGKSRAAAECWRRFGDVRNYVEPFFGSGAMLLGRPGEFSGNETINDFDGYVANFWRSIKLSPVETAEWADNPVNENDLHARHVWLVQRRDDLAAKLEGDPDWYDPKIAGWWVWGMSCWIGSGFCSGKGPWHVVDGELIREGNNGHGVIRQLVHLGGRGQGVNRQLVHLGGSGQGVNRQLVHLGGSGRGVNRQLVHLGGSGRGESRLCAWFQSLSDRISRVRVCSGDWSRICGPSVTFKHCVTAVFLDPPYAAKRTANIYRCDSNSVAHKVREWAVENGKRDDMMIALCGYDGEHDMPDNWAVWAWKANGGLGSQSTAHDNPNARKERIWFSPACLNPAQMELSQ